MILRQMAGIAFPADRIFSQTVSGAPKSEVLESLQAAHPEAGAYHFVEDKLSTLFKARGLRRRVACKLTLRFLQLHLELARSVAAPPVSPLPPPMPPVTAGG